jgi:hypothetical protein
VPTAGRRHSDPARASGADCWVVIFKFSCVNSTPVLKHTFMYKSQKKPASSASGVAAAGHTPSGGAAAGTSAPIKKVVCKKRIKKVTPATQSKKVREPFHFNLWQHQQLISTRFTIVQGNPKKGMWWSTEELDMMLDIIADIKPTGILWFLLNHLY